MMGFFLNSNSGKENNNSCFDDSKLNCHNGLFAWPIVLPPKRVYFEDQFHLWLMLGILSQGNLKM